MIYYFTNFQTSLKYLYRLNIYLDYRLSFQTSLKNSNKNIMKILESQT